MDETGKQAAKNEVLTRVGYCVCTLLPMIVQMGHEREIITQRL